MMKVGREQGQVLGRELVAGVEAQPQVGAAVAGRRIPVVNRSLRPVASPA